MQLSANFRYVTHLRTTTQGTTRSKAICHSENGADTVGASHGRSAAAASSALSSSSADCMRFARMLDQTVNLYCMDAHVLGLRMRPRCCS